ncbi:MAG: ATP-binding protein [Gammaproteobacteria bacterium]
MDISKQTLPILERIADLLEHLQPQITKASDLQKAQAFIWQAQTRHFLAIDVLRCIDLSLLKDISNIKTPLLENTQRFAQGLPAHNALLWGARGMGKSSFVKAVFKEVCQESEGKLALVEVHREDLADLPEILVQLTKSPRRFILFCDDLSFDAGEAVYKSLKVILEGSIAGRPDNVIFYATSNRRHLMPETMVDNEQSTAIHPSEAVEEKVSLSDRFGLWLGFHSCSEAEYLAMVENYASAYKLDLAKDTLHQEAKAWAMLRGARSGRVAWQYIIDLAGRKGCSIE